MADGGSADSVAYDVHTVLLLRFGITGSSTVKSFSGAFSSIFHLKCACIACAWVAVRNASNNDCNGRHAQHDNVRQSNSAVMLDDVVAMLLYLK